MLDSCVQMVSRLVRGGNVLLYAVTLAILPSSRESSHTPCVSVLYSCVSEVFLCLGELCIRSSGIAIGW
jgi:hypothetical protein